MNLTAPLARILHAQPDPAFANNPNYRADVDGLRALAVALVILFHYGLGRIHGGFIGVDIFFVISGYVITALMVREISEGKFSFKRFYTRRIRRLLPAMLAMLLFTLIGAALLFAMEDMLALAYATVSGLLSAANIYYYNSTNYFNADADVKPLLHTWSLSVEEQFYLFWPITLVLLMRVAHPRARHAVLLLLGAASLGAAMYFTKHDAMAGFYLLPARIYEFLLGALVVFLPPLVRVRGLFAEALFAIALLMMLVPAFTYSQQTPFPSYHALLPCLGAALAIYTVPVARRLARLFANRVSAYVGRISYELYLFHWPVLVLVKYASFAPLTLVDRLGLLLVTIALSVAVYHTIGFPIRMAKTNLGRLSARWILPSISVAAASVALLCLSIRADQGWPWRIPAEMRLFIEQPGEFHKQQFGGAGYADNQPILLGSSTAKPELILFGDSFAAQYATGLDQYLKKRNRAALGYFRNGCFMAPEVTIHWRGQVNRECSVAFHQVQKLAEGNRLPVIYAQSWTAYKETLMRKSGELLTFDKASHDSYYQFMLSQIDAVRAALGDRVMLIAGISPGTMDQKAIARCFRVPNILPNQCASTVRFPAETSTNGQEFNLVAEKYVAAHPGTLFLNPRDELCKDGWCTAIAGGKTLYSDVSHLSKDGSIFVMDQFGPTLEKQMGGVGK